MKSTSTRGVATVCAIFCISFVATACSKVAVSTTPLASCSMQKGFCIDYYVPVGAIVQSNCKKQHGTWTDGKACDRAGAVVGCRSNDSVRWFTKPDGESDQALKDYVAKVCTVSGGDIGLVAPDWRR